MIDIMAQHEKKMIPVMAYGVRGASSSTKSHGAPGTSKDVRKGIWSALLALAVVLCLPSLGWSACHNSYKWIFKGSTSACAWAGTAAQRAQECESFISSGSYTGGYCNTTPTSNRCTGDALECYCPSPNWIICDTPAELDSVKCLLNPSSCAIDTTVCDADKAKCAASGGQWSGSAQPDGCHSSCDLCNTNAQNIKKNQWISTCCNASDDEGQPVAPPTDIIECYTPVLAIGAGMNYSLFSCSGVIKDCSCRTLDYDETAMDDYITYCQNGEVFNVNIGDSSPSDSSGAPSDTLGDGQGDWEYDYYGILDTIRDTLVRPINRNLELIASCLSTRQCVGGGDTVIVDVKPVGDSISVMNDTTRKWLKRLADSIGVNTEELVEHLDSIRDGLPKNLIDSLRKFNGEGLDSLDALIKGVGKGFRGVDSLIDSALYWLSQGSAPFESTLSVLGDSIGSVNGAIGDIGDRLDSMWNSDGANVNGLGDTLYDGYVNGSDTSGNGYLGELGSVVDSMGSDSVYAHIFRHDTARGIDSSLFALPNIDSAKVALQASIDSDYAELEGQMQTYFDTLRDEIQLINFDSAIIAPLSDKVPNTNTCPADCFAIDMSGAGAAFSEVKGLSWPLCKSWSALGGMNVLLFLRVILRIICAITCVYIGVWFIAGKR